MLVTNKATCHLCERTLRRVPQLIIRIIDDYKAHSREAVFAALCNPVTVWGWVNINQCGARQSPDAIVGQAYTLCETL